MANLGELPPVKRPVVISSGKPRMDFSYVKNGIIRPLNDSLNLEMKADGFPYYAAKVQGAKKIKSFTDVNGGGKGGGVYIHPDSEEPNQDHFLFAFGNKIKVKIGDFYSTVRDVSDDSNAITFMSVVQAKRYAYIAIGDSTMNNKAYRYDGITKNTKTISSVAGNAAYSQFTTSANHLLVSGDYVKISGTTDYDGEYSCTRINDTVFRVTGLAYTSTKTGTMTGHPKITGTFAISGLNAPKSFFPMDDRLGSVPAGTQSTLPQFSNLSTAGVFDDFGADTGVADGGEFSGNVGSVNFGFTHRSLQFLFSDNQITIHSIKPPIYVGGSNAAALSKDLDTIKEGFTLDALGCTTPKGVAVGFGLLFFVDPKKGIYQYDAISQRLTNLSKSFSSILGNFDLSSASIVIEPTEELLVVTAATSVGIGQNVQLIYSFQSKRWSTDYTKIVNQLVWNPVSKELYGLGSSESSVYRLYDGTFSTDTGSPIEIEIATSYFDAERRSRYKEYLESSVEVAFEDDIDSFSYEIFSENDPAPQVSETVDLTKFVKTVDAEPNGPFGESVSGEGFFVRDRSLVFKRHFNDDPIDDFKKASIKIREKSSFNFAIGFPELIALPTEDEVDETS